MRGIVLGTGLLMVIIVIHLTRSSNKIQTSGQSNLTKGRIAAPYGRCSL